MKRFLHILSVLVTLTSITFTLSAQQQETSKQTIIANLRQELTKTKSAKDSIIILYDIFDLSRQREKVSVGNEILKTASHIGDVRTKLDIYRQLTSSYHDDNDFLKLIKAVKKLPDSREKKETLTFLEMKRLSFSSKFTPESERQRAIAKLIADEPQDKKGNDDDATEKLMALYTLVEYLRNEAPGEMLEKYLDKLVKQVNSESFELYALPNTVYSEAANIYSDAGDATRAIEADRKLLEVIDGLDAKYKAQGREFRDYARNRYVVYRRMMRNYKGLKPGDADDLMEKARQLAEIDADVKADLELQPRMKAYYNMATGNYAEAIPYIKRLLDKDTETTSYNGNAVRRQLLEMLVTAAEKTGDDQTRIKALTEYNAMLNEYEDLKASQRYKELQIKYDIADLKEQNSQLELEAKDSKIKSMRRSMILELTAFGIVVVVLVFFLLYWSRFQKNTYDMGKVVDQLAAERNRIRRTLYYDYADFEDGGDPLGDDMHADHWRDRLKKNNQKHSDVAKFMTESLVNDLLYIAAVSASDRHKYIHEISIDKIMREAIREAHDRMEEPDILTAEYPEKNFSINIDNDCLRSLLSHVAEVAAKYTKDGGVVEMACRGVFNGQVEFTFVMPEKIFGNPDDPRLFDLFIDTHQILEHKGSGLYICRMISMLIDCNFRNDRTYTGPGSRIVIMVPVR